MEVEGILERLVSINSIFGNEKAIGEYLESRLRRLGFSTRRQYLAPGRFNIFAERGVGSRSLMFYGHMDTVTAHGKWKKGPFGLRREGDRLYGLGACDMKGGIAAMLKALESGRDRKIKVLLCADEENISKGAWTAVKERRWFGDVAFMVSCEPGDSKRHNGGAHVITVGRRGRVVIEADVYGLSSHGANPQRGINAIDEASRIVLASRAIRLREHKELGKENIFVRDIVARSDSALDLPDRAHLEFDMQLVPPSTARDAVERVNILIRNMHRAGKLREGTVVTVKMKKRPTPYIDPYIDNLHDPRIIKLLSLIKSGLRNPVLNYGSSVADDNILANSFGRPIVTIGPVAGNLHAPEEWTSLKSLRELVTVYGLIISRI
jgi:acetylornithine deacetylase/succinyl-diaminopimelate desuccinylase-like protein